MSIVLYFVAMNAPKPKTLKQPKPTKPLKQSRQPGPSKPGKQADQQPKRRNAPETKARILAAAQTAFARVGYAGAGIRDIAAIAGISSTLLPRYFGSKAGLFEAALVEALRMEELFEQDMEHFGERLASLLMAAELNVEPLTMIALATGDPEAGAIATRVTEAHALKPLAKRLGPPDARVRALQIILLSTGFVLYMRQLPLLRSNGTDRQLEAWFAGTIQAIVDRA